MATVEEAKARGTRFPATRWLYSLGGTPCRVNGEKFFAMTYHSGSAPMSPNNVLVSSDPEEIINPRLVRVELVKFLSGDQK